MKFPPRCALRSSGSNSSSSRAALRRSPRCLPAKPTRALAASALSSAAATSIPPPTRRLSLSLLNSRAATCQEVEDEQDERDDQDQVHQATAAVREEADEPQNDQDDDECPNQLHGLPIPKFLPPKSHRSPLAASARQ